MKILASVLILFFGYSLAFAHSCITYSRLNYKEHSEKLQKVDKFFFGEIISITEVENQTYLIKFKVIRAWKGIESNEITAKFGNPCGIVLFVGEKRMVYGYNLQNKNIIDVNCCNFDLFDGERMKCEYGEGKSIEEPQPIETTESFWSVIWKKIVSFFS